MFLEGEGAVNSVHLKTVIKLLESEINLKNKELTKLCKIDVSQKSEIKKLSILIDYQKHELHKDIATDQDVPDYDNSSSSSKACNNSTEVPVSVNRRRRKPKLFQNTTKLFHHGNLLYLSPNLL